jgi:glycosyltransferase involved in cell wall biosynthesis
MSNGKTKIAIVSRSLAIGGAERSSALLSILLSNAGFEVHIVTIIDEIEFEYQGKLFNLGILKKKDDSITGRFKRMLVFRDYINKNKFDWIIDNRTSRSSWSDFIVSRFVFDPPKTIYVIRSFNIQKYFPKNQWIAKIIYRHSPYIVCVSEEIKKVVQKTYGYTNLVRIYNPIDTKKIVSMAGNEVEENRYILAYGRIEDEIKNYSLLIDAYAKSLLPKQNMLLFIVGDGSDVLNLKEKVEALMLSDKIIFKPKIVNPFPIVKHAYFTVLTSHFEGFPRVIIESLSVGTPVISVDCQSGPKEIIQNEKNGLLVENYNVPKLSEAMNRFVQDHELYRVCKENARDSVAHLSLDNIAAQWKEILEKH